MILNFSEDALNEIIQIWIDVMTMVESMGTSKADNLSMNDELE
jgi:hypothetical protein